jgi:hypothetical protein
MRERLRALFCAYRSHTNRTPNQSAILHEAGLVILSARVTEQVICATIEELEAAFENTPGRPINSARPIFGANILEFPSR